MISVLMDGYSGYKMKDVGSGYGKVIGGIAAGIPGMILGHYAGKNAPDNPDKDIDENKASHRIGVIADEGIRAGRMAKYAAIGAVLGMSALTVAKAIKDGDLDPETLAKVAGAGGLIGAAGGVVGSTIKGRVEAADRLGYGTTGKVGAALTPLSGVFRPKKLNHHKEK